LKKVMGVPSVTDERLHEVGGVCMLKIFMYWGSSGWKANTQVETN
jgi:hypothetical protein